MTTPLHFPNLLSEEFIAAGAGPTRSMAIAEAYLRANNHFFEFNLPLPIEYYAIALTSRRDVVPPGRVQVQVEIEFSVPYSLLQPKKVI